MITIEEEIKQIVTLLSYPAGYSLSLNGELTLSPIYGTIEHWEVFWEEIEDSTALDYRKIFFTLEEAVTFFVEKRRYLCLGVDFNQMYAAPDGDH